MRFSLGLLLWVMPMVRCFSLLFLLVPKFLFLSVPSHNVLRVRCTVWMLLEGGFQCQFPFQLTLFFPMSPLVFEIISSYFSHSLSKALCVFGDMSLSSNSTFLCTGASTGDFRKSSSFCMNGFSKDSLNFSCRFLSGIQFLGSSFSSCSMVQISNTSPSLQSFSAKATTWSLGRCKCS